MITFFFPPILLFFFKITERRMFFKIRDGHFNAQFLLGIKLTGLECWVSLQRRVLGKENYILFNLIVEIAADISLLCPPSLVEPLATTQGIICNLRIQEIYLGFIPCNQYDSTVEPNYFGCVDFFLFFNFFWSERFL